MSEAAARTQRASALEEKRRRLEDLKKRREERGNDTARIHATANLDEYIDDLLKETTTATASSCETQVTHVSPSPTEDVNNTTLTPPINDSTGNEKQETISSSSGTTTTTATSATLRKLVETFTISTQTEDELPDDDIVEPDDDDDDERKEKIKGNKKDEANNEQPEAKEELKFLSPHEVEKEVSKQPFSMFINTASKKVERMLGTQSMLSDLLVDYVAETADRDSVLHTNSREHDDTTFVQSRQIYECHKWTPNRDVTDLDWSPIHRELLLSTYHMSAASLLGTTTAPNKGQIAVSSMLPSHDTLSASLTPRSGELLSDGLALIWSPMLPQRPEHVFTCGSPVTSGRFHPTDAALIIGGCESGQLVIWDIRSGRLPVQKSSIPTVSSMSKGHHAHAIGTMQVMDGGVRFVSARLTIFVYIFSLAAPDHVSFFLVLCLCVHSQVWLQHLLMGV
jgi:dynein intermediate chain, cytosolic